MFDFLRDDESPVKKTAPTKKERGESVMPIIRKPVPIEESARADLAAKTAAANSDDQTDSEFDFLHTDGPVDGGAMRRSEPSEDRWDESLERPVAMSRPSKRRGFLWLLPVLGLLLAAVYLLGYLDRDDGLDSTTSDTAITAPDVAPINTPNDTSAAVQPMAERFASTLLELRSLVQAGKFDEAQIVLDNMDRTLYGYGQPEFGQLSEQVKLREQTPEPSVDQAELDRQKQAEEQAAQVTSES